MEIKPIVNPNSIYKLIEYKLINFNNRRKYWYLSTSFPDPFLIKVGITQEPAVQRWIKTRLVLILV